MSGLKIMKIAVSVLTFLLFFGIFLSLKIVYERAQSRTFSATDINLGQPEGSTIKNIVADEKVLYIIVENGGLSDRILVFSPEKHQVLYTVNMN